MLTFASEATDEQVAAIEAALSGLPARLPGLRAYTFGRDAGINEGQASFAVVADFDTVGDYVEYRDDPEHRRILGDLIAPILAARTAAQYEF
jgi:Stress responsive A/B Barrel Domain